MSHKRKRYSEKQKKKETHNSTHVARKISKKKEKLNTAQRNHVHILNLFQEKGKSTDNECKSIIREKLDEEGVMVATAAFENDLKKLQELREKGAAWGGYSPMIHMARNGNLEMLKYAVENGCPFNERLLLEAAEHGHLPIIVFGIERGLKYTTPVSYRAAVYGHQHIVEWLDKKGFNIDKECKTASFFK